MFEGQRHPGRPDAAHPDPEERATGEEHAVRGREAAEKREDRNSRGSRTSTGLAAPAIGGGSGSDTANNAEERADREQSSRERVIDREAPLDVYQDKGEDVEIEPVERPSQVGGPEGLPLVAGNLAIPGPGCPVACHS